MKLTQVKGNTWVLEGDALMPLYKLDDHRCVLLDTGLKEEQEGIEAALAGAGLTPVGILSSHAHTDHCGNNRYFQQERGVKVALTAEEAGLCSSLLALKCYFVLLPLEMVDEQAAHMVHRPDVYVPPVDGAFEFCGAVFHIIHSPGHSAGHICTVTPDGVCSIADAVLGHEWKDVKLPYNLNHATAEASREKLRGLEYDTYILAHRDICGREEFLDLVEHNQQLLHRRAEDILALVTRPMTAGEVNAKVCEAYQLFTKRLRRALWVERNVRFFLEYLVDRGDLVMECRRGMTHYRKPED